jgi:hypothetical protein
MYSVETLKLVKDQKRGACELGQNPDGQVVQDSYALINS